MFSSTSLFVALAGLLTVAAQETPAMYKNNLLAKVLLYTYTDGFRHDSIPTAINELQKWGPYYNVSFDATEDQSKFNAANLAKYDAIMFVHTTGNPLSATGQTAFLDYLNKGGNVVAIHAASAAYMEKAWAPYTNCLGATFDHHPARQNATFVKLLSHPSSDESPDRWVIEEEVYSFTSDPRSRGAKVVFTVDPASYKENNVVKAQGDPHPITWYQEYNAGASSAVASGPGVAGRSFYSSLGHKNETWRDATFMKHVMGGLYWTFASNTTWVAQGLYNGVEPTVHTGSTANLTSAAVQLWAPLLGSNETAPPPPPPTTPAATSPPPGVTGSSSSTGTSGALMIAPAAFWAIATASLGAWFGAL